MIRKLKENNIIFDKTRIKNLKKELDNFQYAIFNSYISEDAIKESKYLLRMMKILVKDAQNEKFI